MKFAAAVLAMASIAIHAEGKQYLKGPSPWAVERTNRMMHQLERTYGKGLYKMVDPHTGKVDPTTFGWDNHRTGGQRLGAQISIRVTDGLTIDGTGFSAFMLGAARGFQYTGITQDQSNRPNAQVELTNCFASTYAFLSALDVAALNRQEMRPESGGNKYFDVLFIDPTTIMADFAVNFEMCEFKRIIEQTKDMASLDYAAVADNATRELGVLITESPELAKIIKDVRGAADCLAEVAEDAKDIVDEFVELDGSEEGDDDEWQEVSGEEQGDDGFQEQDGSDFEQFTTSFQADIDALQFDTGDVEDLANAAANCIGAINSYEIGMASGKFFADFFNNSLKPLV